MQRLETYLQTYIERTGVRMTENICKLLNGIRELDADRLN